MILSDEVYEHVVFDGALHHSMARHPELAERSVIVFSFGKSYHVTGWRVRLLSFSLSLSLSLSLSRARRADERDPQGPPIHGVRGRHADAVRFRGRAGRREQLFGFSAFYQRKRDLLAAALAKSRFELLPSEGSFFMLARFRAISEESDSDFVLRLIRDFAVATIPLSAFYSDGTDHSVIRLSFAKDDATLIECARRLCLV